MNNKKLMHKLLYLLPAAAAVLTALPWCAKLRLFADGEYFFEYFSGYSLVLTDYGVWCNMVTGIYSVVLAILGFVHARNEKPQLLSWIMDVSIVAVMMGVTPLAFGSVTIVGSLVFACLVATAVVVYRLH